MKLFVIWLTSLIVVCQFVVYQSLAQVTFIGELRHGDKTKSLVCWGDKSVQQIECDFRNHSSGQRVQAVLHQKESFYEPHIGTEIVLTVDNQTSKLRNLSIGGSTYQILQSIARDRRRLIRVYLTKNINLADYDIIIKDKVFKLRTPIELNSPEKWTLISMLNTVYYSLNDSLSKNNFYSTKNNLDIFLKKQKMNATYFFDSSALVKFYALYSFLEEYVNPTSFFRVEANTLKNSVTVLHELLLNREKKIDSASSYYQYENKSELADDYASSLLVLEEYENTLSKLSEYHSKLQSLLFSPCNVDDDDPNHDYTNGGYVSTESANVKQKNLWLSVGTSFSLFTRSIYNVTISSIDTTVQFESLSKMQTAISFGLVVKPFSTEKNTRPGRQNVNLKSEYGVIGGVFINYFLSPTSTDDFIASPFGLGLGIGYSANNFALLGTISFRKLREPRKYFISQFEGQNRKIPIDSAGTAFRTVLFKDDNTIFIDKWRTSIGVTFIYRLPAMITRRL